MTYLDFRTSPVVALLAAVLVGGGNKPSPGSTRTCARLFGPGAYVSRRQRLLRG